MVNLLVRNLYFLYERYKQAFKENSEYKINLWSAIGINIVTLIIGFIFFDVYSNVLGNDILDWNIKDFFIYMLITLAGSKSFHIFSLKRFNISLVTGKLNVALIRPINPFIYMSVSELRGPVLIVFPMLLLSIFLALFFYDYANVFFFFLFFVFGFFYFSMYNNIFQLLAFFMMNNIYYIDLASQTNGISRQYIPKTFDGFSFNFFYFLPSSIFGYFNILILKDNILDVLVFIPYLIGSFVLMLLISFLLWKIGMSKYEAFG